MLTDIKTRRASQGPRRLRSGELSQRERLLHEEARRNGVRMQLGLTAKRTVAKPGERKDYFQVGHCWVIECRTEAAVKYVRRRLAELMKELDGMVVEEVGEEPPDA